MWKGITNRFEECIKSNAWKLSLSERVINDAVLLVNEMPKTSILDKTARTVAAASIYISTIYRGKRRTQKELAEAFDVATISIRSRYKDMLKELDLNRILGSS